MSKILGQHIKSPEINWTPYTMVISAATPPTLGGILFNQAYWRRIGDSMQIRYDLFTNSAGTAGSGTYLFSIPPTFTIDQTKIQLIANGVQPVVGVAEANNNLGSNGTGYVIAFDATQLTISATSVSSSNALPIADNNYSLATGSLTYSFVATVPITGWDADDVLRISDNSKV